MIRWRASLIAYCVAVPLWISTEYTAISMAPASVWLTYDAIDVVEPAKAGGPLIFSSVTTVHRNVDLRWNDRLYCNVHDGQGFVSWSTMETSGDDIEPHPEASSAWVYTAAVPPMSAECFGRHTITLRLKYGIEKSFTLRSGVFELRRPS